MSTNLIRQYVLNKVSESSGSTAHYDGNKPRSHKLIILEITVTNNVTCKRPACITYHYAFMYSRTLLVVHYKTYH